MNRRRSHAGLSLLEILATLGFMGVLIAVIVPRIAGGASASKVAGCHTLKGDIEVQVQLWRHHTGAWPASNLATIGADPEYFPAGLPTCPVDGTSYTIDATGRVVGHSH